MRYPILMLTTLALIMVVRAASAATAELQFSIEDKAGWYAGQQNLPASATETYQYDKANDTLTVSVRFNRKGLAPLPPMLAIAVQHGFPITFEAKPETTGTVSALGPLMGIKDADGYTYRIAGLGRYVFGRPQLGSGQVPESLQKELVTEVQKLLAAGRLRPWMFLVNVPGSGADARGDVFWDNPAEVLYLLAEVAPVLPTETAESLKAYARAAREALPPETVGCVSYTEGKPREVAPHDKRLLQQWQDKVMAYRTKAPPGVWNLYGLARYYELTGERPTPDVMAKCSQIVNRQLENRDWATLYWKRGHAPAFNAVHGVNQLFAGFIGYIRLAQLAGDDKAEALGWGMLGRMAVLRFAMGKYTHFLYDSHQFAIDYRVQGRGGEVKGVQFDIKVQTDPAKYQIPKDPAWWAKAHANNWIGELVTWNWQRPTDNVRQVERLDETGVDVWEWAGTDNGGTGQKRDYSDKDYWYNRLAPYLLPFRDMTPEMARFLGDHLKPETEVFCHRVAVNLPHWYATYSEAVLGAEIGFNHPADAYSHFLARAWVLGQKPQQLEKYVDVPWLRQGDLYYMHKLAETIKAYRRTAK